MDYSINPAVWSRAFPIPCDITDKHIKMCSGVALKCLLLILRSPDEYGSIEVLAKKLGQPNSEIADALNYWEEQGIIFKAESGAIPILKAVEKSNNICENIINTYIEGIIDKLEKFEININREYKKISK